jgi:surface protein
MIGHWLRNLGLVGCLDGEGGGDPPPPPPPNDAFQILVQTDNAGTSDSDQMTLPATGTYTVDWGDATIEIGVSGPQTHTYAQTGQYIIKITGGLTRIDFNSGGDRLKLLEIQNWGDIAWTTMQNAFRGCANMELTATDAPDLTGVTVLQSMFDGCTLFNSSINHWDVSGILNMQGMLGLCTNFDQPLGSWNTSAVTNMRSMFFGSGAFNRDIGGWVTSSVTDTREMFRGATAFNQDIGGWDVGNLTQAFGMFRGATAFDQDISTWDVSKVTDFTDFMRDKTSANFSAANLTAIYNGWSQLTFVNTGLTAGFGSIKYTSAGAAGRAILTGSPNNWSITDGGQE